MLAALSLNKSQLAKILHVTRPTIYEWLNGKAPSATNTERLANLLEVLNRIEADRDCPINSRFVRRSISIDTPPLIDLLSAEQIDFDLVEKLLKEAKLLTIDSMKRIQDKEKRLSSLGYEEPSEEQRGQNIETTIALMDNPDYSRHA